MLAFSQHNGTERQWCNTYFSQRSVGRSTKNKSVTPTEVSAMSCLQCFNNGKQEGLTLLIAKVLIQLGITPKKTVIKKNYT